MSCLWLAVHAAPRKSKPHKVPVKFYTVAAQAGRFLDENGLAINRVMALFRAVNDVLGLLHLFRCSVDDEHILVGLQGDIVLQYAVLRDAIPLLFRERSLLHRQSLLRFLP